MILWRKIEIIHFYHFDSDPRFPPFLLYVRLKSGSLLNGDVSVMKFKTSSDIGKRVYTAVQKR